MDHRSGRRFARCSSLVKLFQFFGVPDSFIHKGTKDLVLIRPVLIVGAQVPCLQTFCELGPVFIPVKVCLKEHEMEKEPKLDALVRPNGMIMGFVSTGGFAKCGGLIKVFNRKIILVVYQQTCL